MEEQCVESADGADVRNKSPAIPADACMEPNGFIAFPELMFPEPGVYRFVIRERTQPGQGWIPSDKAFRVTITVKGEPGTTFIADVQYPDGVPLFENRYQTLDASVALSANEEFNCASCLKNESAVYGLFTCGGERVAAAVSQHGGIRFPSITYHHPGTYKYIIRSICAPRGRAVAPNCYPVTVTVIDNGKGQLQATVRYPNGYPSFSNAPS